MNRKEVFARYGIQFNSGKIIDPTGKAIAPLLKTGNSKTGKAVLTFSISVKSCPCKCPGCYAQTGFYNMPSVKNSLEYNFMLCREYLDFVDRAIRAQLDTCKPGQEVRIHAAGDFFSDAYAEMWRGIVADYPSMIFWTYTKAMKYEAMLDDYDNGNIVKSLIPGIGLNFGHCDYIADTYEKLIQRGESVHICRCGIDSDQHCAGCHACSSHKYVLFIEHSTGYIAESDPALDRVKTIINAQQ